MATITTRSGKGSPLTNDEVDSNFTNLNTDKVEKSGDTLTGNLSFGDNNKAIFGASNDLQIYHDGSDTQIREVGAGNLKIITDGAAVQIQSTLENMIVAQPNDSVTLYYDNSQKLETTSSGINVTGSVVSDGLTVDAGGEVATFGNILANNFISVIRTDLNPSKIQLGASSNQGVIRYIASNGFKINDITSGEKRRLEINSNGDVSFYEDTGTTAKLTWDASAESLNFADNGKAVFGAGSDLQIFHDGSTSVIKDAGTGELQLHAENNLRLQNLTGSTYAKFTNGAQAELYYAGNVKLTTTNTGINVTGTVTADGLTVDGTATVGAGTSDIFFADSFNSAVRTPVSAGHFYIQTASGAKTLAQFEDNNDIRFYEDTGTTPKFFWDASTERLGIGTSSPASSLHISGSDGDIATLEGTGTGVDVEANLVFNPVYNVNARIVSAREASLLRSRLTFETADDNTGNTIPRLNISGVGDISFYEDTGTTAKFFWDATAESLGLGTTNLSSKRFRAVHATNASADFRTTDGNDIGFEIDVLSSVSEVTIGTGTNNPLAIKVNDTEAMRITQAGNVGIGTDNPSAKLHVSTTTPEVRLQYAGNSYFQKISTDSANNLVFGTGANGTERLRIDSSGNLLVGKTSSTYNIAGTALGPDGRAFFTADGSYAGAFNRKTSDGDIVLFSKNGNTVGSIGTAGGSLDVYSSTTDRVGLRLAQAVIPMFNGATSPNTVDLGTDVRQFKDLYLSGGLRGDTLTFSSNAGVERMRIDSGGRVGIGIASSGAELVVSDGTDGFEFNAGSTSVLQTVSRPSGAYRDLHIKPRELILTTNNTEALRVTTGGNVGIGTSSPAGLLEISADSDDGTASPSFLITNSSTTLNDGAVVGTIEFKNSDSSGTGPHVAKIQGIANASDERTTELAFSTGSVATTTERMRIDSSGNVGIGTDNPSSKLEVVSASTNANTLGLTVRNTSSTNDPQFELGVGYAGYYDDSAVIRHNNNVVAYITSLGDWHQLKRMSLASDTVIQSMANGNAQINLYDTNGDVTFSSNANTIFRKAGSEYMRIDSSGNVGIGTSSPTEKFNVEGSGNVAIKIKTSGGGVPQLKFVSPVGTESISANVGSVRMMQFNVGGSERLRIDASGNVGIGTDIPAKKLDVYSTTDPTIRISNGGGTSPNPKLEFFRQTGVSATIQYDVANKNMLFVNEASSANAIIWKHTSSAEAMRIDSSGNVGIGTTSPATTLEVSEGDGANTVARFTNTAQANSFIQFNDTASTVRPRIGSAGDNLILDTANTERMRIDSAGRVGIGTTEPVNELEIYGGGSPRLAIRTNSETVNEAMELGFQVGTSANASANTVALISGKITQANPSALKGDLLFNTNSGDSVSEKMRIDSSGNLLVGTTDTAPARNNTTGVALTSGRLSASKSGSTAIEINRDASDGALIALYRAGAQKANIGLKNNNPYIENGSNSIQFSAADVRPRTAGAGGNLDATIDLGVSGARFKDLFLSGGIYVGGTGSANHLDDYEEGTWTGVIADAESGGNESATNCYGYYTKVGNMVYVHFNVQNIDTTGLTGSNDVYITGLPFTSNSATGNAKYTGTAHMSVVAFAQTPILDMNESATAVRIAEVRNGAGVDHVIVSQLTSLSSDIHGNLVYQTV